MFETSCYQEATENKKPADGGIAYRPAIDGNGWPISNTSRDNKYVFHHDRRGKKQANECESIIAPGEGVSDCVPVYGLASQPALSGIYVRGNAIPHFLEKQN